MHVLDTKKVTIRVNNLLDNNTNQLLLKFLIHKQNIHILQNQNRLRGFTILLQMDEKLGLQVVYVASKTEYN